MRRKNDRWFKNKIKIKGQFREVIYEVVTGDDDTGFGFAVADIDQSQMHIHNRTTEVYTLISGDAYVWVGDGDRQVHLSKPGDTVAIPPGTHHYVITHRMYEFARVAVLTIPAWSPDDHVLTEKYTDAE